MKNIFFIFIISLSIFKIFLFNCIPNKNCLTERGECIDNKCVCYEEFWTLKSNIENKLPNIFCNYERGSRFLPLILEFFLPGAGHIVMKKYILASIKIGLLLVIFICFYTGFINHKSEKIEENAIKISQNILKKEEEQTQLINNENDNENQSSKNLNQLSNDENNKNNYENYNTSEVSEDLDSNFAENEQLHVANHEEIPISFFNKLLNFVGFFSLICFFIFYPFDLIAYGFAFYKDSNNVPFL
jgi:hypothetical protein